MTHLLSDLVPHSCLVSTQLHRELDWGSDPPRAGVVWGGFLSAVLVPEPGFLHGHMSLLCWHEGRDVVRMGESVV